MMRYVPITLLMALIFIGAKPSDNTPNKMSPKRIERILTPPPPHMVGDGFRVHTFFPGPLSESRMSPFFMMDYNSKVVFPPTDKPRGVGVHPHRGFETVTIAYHGRIAHHDSYGNSGIIGEGDVQWMTAASGILHKEYHEREYSKKGGPFQMVQLWVNLPAKDKMSKPKYQEITRKNMGVVTLPDNAGTIDIIAGECKGVKGPAYTFTDIHAYNVRLNKGGKVDLSFPASHNTCILVIEGSATVNESQKAVTDNFVLFANEGESISLKTDKNTILLVLSGAPIKEPIAAYGPFLMNTQAEINQAINDYNAGKFGVLND